MAERGRKPGFHMSNERRFYVYRFVVDGKIMYIGKGTGRRLKNQERRFGFAGEIVKRFVSESAAYNAEYALIRKCSPPWNKLAGGGGAIARTSAKLPLWFRKEQAEIKRLGSRKYVAAELLKLDLGQLIAPDQLETLKRVAAISYGF